MPIYFKNWSVRTKKTVGIVAVVFIAIGIILGLLFLSRPTSLRVEKYDNVKIDYTVWESDESKHYDSLLPIFDDVIWIEMIPLNNDTELGIILGLYNNLLGKELYYESGMIWLDKCIDQDKNGIDDITGQPALTFGNSSDQYFNTCLMIKFIVLAIQKSV